MVRMNMLDATAAKLAEEIADVATDPRKLKPGELCRLLNSTPLGDVITDRRLREHRTRAGMRIGEGKYVDLLRYAAWLFWERHDPKTPAPPATSAETYARKRDAEGRRSLDQSAQGRDIGDLPPIVNPRRKKRGRSDFRFFCEQYFPETFRLAWSDDHLKVIAKVETAVLEGGLFAMAMPRGSGKTSLVEAACLWAILYGHRRFVALIGSDAAAAQELLDSMKVELETNELLLEDFPEAVYPIHCLEGISKRCKGQLYRGELTRIDWTAKRLIMPTIPDAAASGAIVKVAGITGRIRGMKHKRADGTPARPDLAIIDDPQTEESAWSHGQCIKREKVVAGAVLGLAGPGEKIAGVMPCTVIRKGDMADTILDRDKHPEWQGERTKLVYAWPTNEELWERYAELRRAGLKAGEGTAEADAFYREHRQAMDAGAKVAWPERKNEDELSALQHAMNLRLDHQADGNDAAFFAEYQNDPPDELPEHAEILSAEAIAEKVSGYKQGQVPAECEVLTAFIDVQMDLLYYLVAAWQKETFSGFVIDYGAYPDQGVEYFTAAGVKQTLALAAKGAGFEGSIYTGLDRLSTELLTKDWQREDGVVVRIDRLLIDANWGRSTDTVYKFVRNSQHAANLTPSHGVKDTASSLPFDQYKRKRGDVIGDHWRKPSVQGKRAVRHVIYPANYWKSFVQARLATAMGDKGCLSLFKAAPRRHRMLAEHLTSEFSKETQGSGRVLQEWFLRPGFDNHLLDCLVGSAVAASMEGVVLMGGGQAEAKRKRLKLSELREQKRGRPRR